jgi:hypothetical protein
LTNKNKDETFGLIAASDMDSRHYWHTENMQLVGFKGTETTVIIELGPHTRDTTAEAVEAA